MLIQNTGSAATAPRLTSSDGAPVPVVVPETRGAPAELQQVAVKAAPEQQPNVAPPSPAQVQGAVDNINKAMKQINANVEFSIDKETNKTIIKVVESTTGEVIRQFPSDEVLAIARAIDNMQQGFLVKQKA